MVSWVIGLVGLVLGEDNDQEFKALLCGFGRHCCLSRHIRRCGARCRLSVATHHIYRSLFRRRQFRHALKTIGPETERKPGRDSRGREPAGRQRRSEEHTSELQSLMRISYAVFCLKKKNKKNTDHT